MPLLALAAAFAPGALADPGVAVLAEGRAVGHPTLLAVVASYAPAPRGAAPHPFHLELHNRSADPLTLVAAPLSGPTCVRAPALPDDPVVPPFGRVQLPLEPAPDTPCDAGATVLLVTSEGLGRVPLDRATLRATALAPDAATPDRLVPREPPPPTAPPPEPPEAP